MLRKQSVRQLLIKTNFSLFVIILILVCFSGCDKNYNNVIDSVGSAPIISGASFSLSIVNTDLINIPGETVRSPDDTITIQGIATVKLDSSVNVRALSAIGYSVTNYNFWSPLAQGTLHDDGVPPDTKANDNIYSGYIEFQIQRVVVGTFSINLWGEGTTGYNSNTIILPLQIVRSNHPPVLSNLSMDSLISISGSIDQNYLQIVIEATDPDGLSDIRIVYFDSFKPDGSPASGNPFLMYDDGNFNGVSGDYSAGDGYFSLKVGKPTSTGTYQFEFHAVDRSNNTSNTVIKNVVVTN